MFDHGGRITLAAQQTTVRGSFGKLNSARTAGPGPTS